MDGKCRKNADRYRSEGKTQLPNAIISADRIKRSAGELPKHRAQLPGKVITFRSRLKEKVLSSTSTKVSLCRLPHFPSIAGHNDHEKKNNGRHSHRV